MITTFPEFCLRAGIAVLFATALGLERSFKNKPVGVRAFMMIALGSACFTMITMNFAFGDFATNESSVSVDPTRVIQGVIGGIGFLGAGAIMSDKSDGGTVRGMGTGRRSGRLDPSAWLAPWITCGKQDLSQPLLSQS